MNDNYLIYLFQKEFSYKSYSYLWNKYKYLIWKITSKFSFFCDLSELNYLKEFYFRKLLFSFNQERSKNFCNFICLYVKWNFISEIKSNSYEFSNLGTIENYQRRAWNWQEWKIYDSESDCHSFFDAVWDREDFFRFLKQEEKMIWKLKYLKNLKNSKILLRLKGVNYKKIDNLSYRINKKLKYYLFNKYEGVIFFKKNKDYFF